MVSDIEHSDVDNDIAQLNELRSTRLRATLDLCAQASPFYSKRWAEAGVDLANVHTVDDLEALPLTTKADFMNGPESFLLDPTRIPDAPLEIRTVWNTAYTTGTTTGRPSPFFNTTHDFFLITNQARVCAEAEGLHRGDSIGNLYPLTHVPHGGFASTIRAAEVLGIPIVAGLTGAPYPEFPIHRSVTEALAVMEAANPSVLWGVPSFLRRFLRRAREEGVNLSNVRMIMTSGEAVSDNLRDEYLDHLRAFGATDPQVRVRYAATEMQGGFVQCRNDGEPHNPTPDLYYFEVVDPDTGKRVPEGEEGQIALTHLHRRGTVFIRYLIGDLIGLRTEHCPYCGRYGERIVIPPHRTGDLIKVRGMLINPHIIFDLLQADRTIREYQIVIRKEDEADPDSMDAMVIKLEADDTEHQRLADAVPALVREAVMVRPTVEFAGEGEIHDILKTAKARRLIDQRAH